VILLLLRIRHRELLKRPRRQRRLKAITRDRNRQPELLIRAAGAWRGWEIATIGDRQSEFVRLARLVFRPHQPIVRLTTIQVPRGGMFSKTPGAPAYGIGSVSS
jgi:hypothetical protein